MVGIISNNAALFAQRNLAAASAESESSIARLSSGRAIIKASDDVSGLAIGTVLQTTVSTLRTILGSTSQASSLLSIADGGLKNVGDILQRQKSLAVQSNTGSLSDNERAFLQQEFSSLTAEIDRIVDNTNFNGIKLLNGSISGGAGLTTATGAATETYSLNANTDFKGTASDLTAFSVLDATTTSVGGTLESDAISFAVAQDGGTKETAVFTFGANASAGTNETLVVDFTNGAGEDFNASDTFLIDGVTFTIGADDVASTGIGTNAVGLAQNLSNTEFANQISAAVNASAGTAVSASSNGTGTLTLTVVAVGDSAALDALDAVAGVGGGIQSQGGAASTVATDGTDADTIDVEGVTFTFVSAVTGSGTTNIAVGGTTAETLNNIIDHLNDTTNDGGSAGGRAGTVGTFTYTTDASSTFTATALAAGVGAVGAGGFTSSSVAVNETYTVGVASAPVTDATYQADLQGGITDLKATYIAATGTQGNSVQFSAKVGGVTYLTDVIALSGGGQDTIAAASSLLFKSQGSNAATDITFTLLTGASAQTVTNQTTLDTLASSIQTEITSSGLTINQSRLVSSFTEANTDGTALQGLTAAEVTIVADAFDTTGGFGSVEAFNVDRANNRITATINDVVYTADLSGSGFTGTYVPATKILTTDGVIVFESASTTDSKQLRIDLGSVAATNITFDTAEGEAALESVFNSAFAIGGSASLNFQVGTTSTDSIGVQLNSSKSSALYLDANGTSVTLDIGTAGVADSSNGGDGTGAILASNVLDRAINTVTSLRATIGALQSRFNFAAANVTSSIQNTEAARSNFLDVDIAAESTAFATAQVRLQASISVLAQANQIPQNLLKLIG